MRDRAQTVIVGAGIVGASAAYHLAELGATDVLVIDQGPLFETGGSTSHAPGLVFQTNGSRTMCRIAQDTVALYDSLELDGEPGWYGVGGIEIATTPERMAELRRRQGFAALVRHRGHGDCSTPAETAEQIPLLDPARSSARTSCPSDGIAKAVRIVTALAREGVGARASRSRAASPSPASTSATAACTACETDRGRIECERVLICAGIWGPTVGRAGRRADAARRGAAPAGVDRSDPRARRRDARGRAPDPAPPGHAMYFRHREDHYGVGNYHHEPIVDAAARHPPARRRSDAVADAVHAGGLRRRPRREAARILPGARRPACGPPTPRGRSTGCSRSRPDAGSIVGESANVRGLWVCEAVWVTHGGGMGQQVAEWMANGEPGYDLAEADANRFYPFQTTPPYVLARGAQQYREVYDILHPLQQMTAPRKLRLTPFYERHVGARRGVLHRRGLGAAAVVRGEPRAADRRRLGAPRRVGGDELVAGRRRRAPGHPRARGAVRHHAVREVRRDRPGRAARSSSGSAPTGSTGRSASVVYTAMLTPSRRDPLRPDGDAQGRGAVPRRDRRRHRASTTWRGCARRSATASASRSPSGPARCSRSGCGDRGRATCCRPSPTPTCRTTRSRT